VTQVRPDRGQEAKTVSARLYGLTCGYGQAKNCWPKNAGVGGAGCSYL
jgi:hypothetical protein